MALQQFVVAKAGEAGGFFISPWLRTANYAANRTNPNIIPDAESAIGAWLQGYLDNVDVNKITQSAGVDLGGTSEHIWTTVDRRAIGPMADLSPEFEDYVLTPWQSIVRTRLYSPSIDECNALKNRGLITNNLYRHYVGRQVDCNKVLTDVWDQMRFEIPGPSDLVRFAVREAYNPELITLFGYNKEVPLDVLPWMEKQGYGGDTGINIPPGGTDGDNNPRQGKATWLDLYWWSHWDLPSLTQGYEMLHRLYPASRFGPSPISAPGVTFTPEELEKLQKAQDIPDYWRPKLQAISYHSIDKTDGDRLYEENLIEEKDYYHILRQRGNTDADAMTLIKLSDLKRQRNLGIEPSKAGLSYICEYYKLGVISDLEALFMLEQLGYKLVEREGFLKKCLLEVKGDTVRESIKTVRLAYLTGIFNKEDLRLELARNGLNPVVTEYWIARWEYQKAIKYKQLSARQNMTAFVEAVIDEDQLQNRLFNLGYDGNSINIMIRIAKQKILKAQSDSVNRQAREDARATKAMSELAKKEQAKVLKKAREDAKIITNKALKKLRNLLKVSTDANIKAWFTDKLITLDEVIYRLYHKGYTTNDAARWVKHSLKDLKEGEIDASSKKAANKFRSEGNYLE